MTSWLYVYGVGGGVFLASLILLIRKKALHLDRPSDRLLIIALVAGAIGYCAFHGLWTWTVLRGH